MYAHASTPLLVTAFGMATPLAPNAADSCAAARAGIRRASELELVDLGEDEALGNEPITGYAAKYIGAGFVGRARAVMLGRLALMDLLSRRPLDSSEWARTAVIVNCSDRFYEDLRFDPEDDEEASRPSQTWIRECTDLIPTLLRACHVSPAVKNGALQFGGHTGFVKVLQQAQSLLLAGQVDRCLVGGIESCIEPNVVVAAALAGVIKTDANPVGFIPGEAAAFVLLERTYRGPVRPCLLGEGTAFAAADRFSVDPPDGVAVAQAVDWVLRSNLGKREEAPAAIIGDLNGDDYRARDWGYALLRLRASHSLSDAALWLPALAYGDTGAASEAVSLCTGIFAQQRGWIQPGLIVEWSAADRGSRAAFGFSAVQS
jgi:3-oxoacyl-[acyl-carrier-protein] synthase I